MPEAKRYKVLVDGLAYPKPEDVASWEAGECEGEQLQPEKGSIVTTIPPDSVKRLLKDKIIKAVK